MMRVKKCISIGYSEDSKAYKLYKPISKKMIAIRDVIFKEEEAWAGNMDEVIRIGAPIPNEEEHEEQVGQPNQTRPSTPERNYGQGQSKNHQNQHTLSVSNTPSIRKGKQNRILKDIYDQEEESLDFGSNFAFFSCDPLCFEAAVKKEHWIKAMDDEI